MIVRRKNDYFRISHYRIGFSNPCVVCLLHGTDLTFNYNSGL